MILIRGCKELAEIYYKFQLWPLISLQPIDWNQCLVHHLKDLFHICLEIKTQGFWMTFKVCNLGSNYPYLLHKMDFVDKVTTTIADYLTGPVFKVWNESFFTKKIEIQNPYHLHNINGNSMSQRFYRALLSTSRN